MKVDPRDIAARAAELATQRNITTRELSIDVTGKPDFIRDMKRGRMPSADRIDALAASLETTVDFLMGRSVSSLRPGDDAFTVPVDRLPQDVPVYGTALGADLDVEDGGYLDHVDTTIIETTEVVDRLRRFPGLAGDEEAYGLYVVGQSMAPRYDDGDPIYVTTRGKASIGDYAVVQIVDATGEVCTALIKRLIGRGATYYELEQFNPPMRFRISADRVARIHRVLTPKEIHGR